MISLYKNLKLTTKLTIAGLVLLLTTAFSIRFEHNILLVDGITLAIMLAFHFGITKPQTIKSVIVLLLQFMFIAFASNFFGQYFYFSGSDPYLGSITTTIVLGITSIIIAAILFKFSKHKIWASLLSSYLTLNFLGFMIGSFLNLNFLVSLIVGVVLGLIVTILFCITFRKKKLTETQQKTRNELRNPTAYNTVKKYLEKNNYVFIPSNAEDKYFITDTRKNIAIIFPIGFSTGLSTDRKDYFYKDISLGNFFNNLVEESKKISLQNKIPQNKISIIIVDTTNRYPLSDKKYDEITLSAKKNYKDVEQKLIITNNFGINNYLNVLQPSKPGYNKSFNKLLDH